MCSPGPPGRGHNERAKESVPSMSVSHASHSVPHQAAGADQLLSGLDPEQREVALALRGPVRVLAGAGTGKTQAITHRIAYGVACGLYVPSRVLAVTFTTRAAGEMRSRLQRLGAPGVQARTFHSAALRQARYFWPKVYGGELSQLVESKLGMVATAARRNRIRTDQAVLRDLAGEIEWSKVSNVRPDDYADVAPGKGRLVADVDPATIGHVFASYEEVKRESARMDMEDVLLCAAAVLTEDERVAAEVRRQYHHFVVDEFQDVSPVQWALLQLWLGDRDELCVVGDPAQTIYSFAGASARYLLDLPKHLPGTTTVKLVRNYRSTPQVIAAANTMVGHGSTTAVQLRSQSSSGPEVTYREHPDEVAEAASVAEEIRRLVDAGTPPGEVAVLFRINAQSEVFEAALADAGLPYVVRGAERFFERPEVRQAIALVRGAARAEDAADAADDVLEQVRGVVSGMGWTPEPPVSRGNVRDRWESLQALVDLVATFVRDHPEAGLAELVADLDRRAADRHAPVADAVTVATLHASKGLEWDAVFLCGAVEGTLPISYALDSVAAVEEERRLCYVGMTRARRHLSISWAAARNPGGRATRRPSRFLDGLRPETASDSRPSGSRPRKSRRPLPTTCRTCGAPLTVIGERKVGRCSSCPPTYDEALFERLRAWRLETARADAMPAFTVFTDATLVAIAEAMPSSPEELLRVSGVGESKRAKYGDAVLEILSAAKE